jgi:hypothetical protein
MFFIERLFTNVVQTLSAVKLEPISIAQSKEQVVLEEPPAINELELIAKLKQPPLTVEKQPLEMFL